jgi:hypothetical protein
MTKVYLVIRELTKSTILSGYPCRIYTIQSEAVRYAESISKDERHKMVEVDIEI